MARPPLPHDEAQRLQVLHDSGLLDSPAEARFDRLTRLAQALLGVPISLISLVDAERQWFKSRQGLEVAETPRDHAFCAHAILDDKLFEVPDTQCDARFASNPLVTGAPFIRFYAGVPLHLQRRRVGTLCIIDRLPRQLDDTARQQLADLAALAEEALLGDRTDALRRQQADAERLRHSERRLAEVIEGTRIGTWEWNIGSGAAALNDTWASIVGYRLDELQPTDITIWTRLTHPDDLARSEALLQRHIAGELDYYDCQYRMRHRDGHWVWVHDRGRVVAWQEDGQALLMSGTHADITEAKRAEEALRHAYELLERSSEAARIGSWELDLDSGRLQWSRVAAAIHGLADAPAPDLAGLLGLYPAGETRQTLRQLLDEAVGEQRAFDTELPLAGTADNPRWVRVIGLPMIEDPHSRQLHGLFQDITARKQAERVQVEALRLGRLQAELALDASLQAVAPELAWPRLAERLQQALRVAQASVWLFDADGKAMRCVAIHAAEQVPAGTERVLQRARYPAYFDALARFSVVAAANALHDPSTRELADDYLRPQGVGAMLDAVIAGASGPCGVLCAEHRGGARTWTAPERAFASSAAVFAGQLLAQHERQQAANLLIDSEQQFRSLVEDVPGAAFRCALDADWTMHYLSEGIAEITGYPASDFIGSQVRSYSSVIHPDDRERVDRLVADAVAGARTWECEYRVLHRDSGPRWVFEKGHAVFAADGVLRSLSGFIHDIDQRRRAEQERERVGTLLRAVLDSASEVSVIATDRDGLITLFNRGAERLLGYRGEEMVGRESPARFHLAEEIAARGRLLGAPQGTPLTGFRVFVDTAEREGAEISEWTYVHRNGRQFPVSLAVTPIRGSDGGLHGYLGIAVDVSAQKEALAWLEISQRQLQRFFDLSPNFMMIARPNGRLERVNRSLIEALGFSETALLNRPLRDLMHEDDLAAVDAALLRLRHGASTISVETRVMRADGGLLHLLWSAATDPDGGRLYATAVDISERRRIEQMKNEFIATVSHELRTPLTSISAALGLLAGGAMGSLPEPVSSLLTVAHNNSQRLGALINDLLDMEKLVAGRMALLCEPVALAPLLTEALEAIAQMAAQRRVALTLQAGHDDERILADRPRLLQVLANLLSNAIKFSPEGETVVLSWQSDGSRATIAVRDRGPGVPAHFRSKLFEKFSQADSSDVRQKGGTGLGLAISRELVERMGGEIGCDSIEGAGSTFWFTLPRAEPASP